MLAYKAKKYAKKLCNVYIVILSARDVQFFFELTSRI